jgi:hypothetical protein
MVEGVGAMDVTHERWIEVRHTAPSDDTPCLFCTHYIKLRGSLGYDWGACTNPASRFDRQVMLEHDGCDAFEEAPDR